MKAWKLGICTLLIAVSLVAAASAHLHEGEESSAAITISSWAEEEVERADELFQIFRTFGKGDYRQPAQRQSTAALAMEYIAAQERSTAGILVDLTRMYLVENDANGRPYYYPDFEPVFSDCPWATEAYYLGLVQGRGDGIFDPQGLITREEAAVMLARAYVVIGGTLPDRTDSAFFTDGEEISDWAKESVAAVTSWGVMVGMGDGSFDPQGTLSMEQCFAAFVRLHDNGPIGRMEGNATPLFTYAQCLDYLLRGPLGNVVISDRVEGSVATMIRLGSEYDRDLPWLRSAYLVYREGGLARLDLGVCARGNSVYAPEMENPAFSEDGKTFTCTVTLPEDVIDLPHLPPDHQKGIYHITVDVETLAYHYEYEPLPAAQ